MNKRVLAIIIILLFAAVAGFAYSQKPTSTPSPSPQTSPSPSPTLLSTINLYLIVLEDAGQTGDLIGCNDSLVFLQRRFPSADQDLKSAIQQLLSIKDQYYGQSGFYNALYNSNLTLDSVSIENNEAIINLSGELVSGGTCDDPRIKAQLTKTALQFPDVQTVSIFINNQPLNSLLSGKGN